MVLFLCILVIWNKTNNRLRSSPAQGLPDTRTLTTRRCTYISAPAASTSTTIQAFVECIQRVDAWMSTNRLRMNAEKTQLLWLGTRQQLDKLSTTEMSKFLRHCRTSASSSTVSWAWSITLLRSAGRAFFSCVNFAWSGRHLTSEVAKTLVHAFVSSRLDYCNCLLYGVSDGLLQKLQAVQNSAARAVTGTRKFDHTPVLTPVLRDLHCLAIWQRLLFKLAMIVFKRISPRRT